MNAQYTVGQKVSFLATNGEPLDAEILALGVGQARLKIDGWLGLHWFALSRIEPRKAKGV